MNKILDSTISLRCNKDEREFINKISRELGCKSNSEFIRMCIYEYINKE